MVRIALIFLYSAWLVNSMESYFHLPQDSSIWDRETDLDRIVDIINRIGVTILQVRKPPKFIGIDSIIFASVEAYQAFVYHNELYNRRDTFEKGQNVQKESPDVLYLTPSSFHKMPTAAIPDHSYSNGNFAFSPYGLASVLVVLYEGSVGESAFQIKRALGFPSDKDIIRVGFRDLHRHLRSYFSHEGYLSGISLNKNEAVLKPEYKRILKLYGYDVDLNDTGVDAQSMGASSTAGNAGTTVLSTLPSVIKHPDVETTTEIKHQNTSEVNLQQINETTIPPTTQPATTFEEQTTNSLLTTTEEQITTSSITNPEEQSTTASITSTQEQTAEKETKNPLEITTQEQTTTSSITNSEEQSATASITSTQEQTAEKETKSPLQISTQEPTTTSSITNSEEQSTTASITSTQEQTAEKETKSPLVISTQEPTTTSSITNPEEQSTSISVTTSTQEQTAEKETKSPLKITTEEQTSTSSITNPEEQSTLTSVTEEELTTKTTTVNPEEQITNTSVTTMEGQTTNPLDTTTEQQKSTTTGKTHETTVLIELLEYTTQPTDIPTTVTQPPKNKPIEHSISIKEEVELTLSLDVSDCLKRMETNGIDNDCSTPTNGKVDHLKMKTNNQITIPEIISNENLDNQMLIPQPGDLETITLTSTEYPPEKALKQSEKSSRKETNLTKAKPRKPRTITDYFESSPNFNLHLHNSMNGISTNADFYQNQVRKLFLIAGSIDIPVPMMTYTYIFPYAYIQRLRAKALEFPLDDPRYKLLIILPIERRGLRRLIYDLTYYPLRDVLDSVKPARVKATIPKFTVEGFVILTSSLQRLGILDVFDPRKANLSGMSTDPELYVRNIEQSVTVLIRNYVEIPDIQTRTMGARYIDYDFEASHPFVYFVLDTATNVALMAGQMLDPLNSMIY